MTKYIMKSLFFTLILLTLGLTNAFALVYIEKDGVYLYYPEEEKEIAGRMAKNLPSFIAFLQEMGIQIEHPVHVVVDADMDISDVDISMIPHREIRIPLRAPGVLEEGYTLRDPWSYFLFKGLCLQGFYSMRSKIPKFGHLVFGDLISPNVIMPQWLLEGTCSLLYDLYNGEETESPYYDTVFRSTFPPDMDRLSNHPGIWPGFFGYKIYGKPFIHFLYKEYGWDALFYFFQLHGGGIIPVEIDLKAENAFNKTWPSMWDDFRKTHPLSMNVSNSEVISGYWPKPFTYWNVSGIYPGLKKNRIRSRYGYMDDDNILWISEYNGNGVSQLAGYTGSVSIPFDVDHLWDPGEGDVCVTRKGHTPCLVVSKKEKNHLLRTKDLTIIQGPEGAVQMSGPVRSGNRIAVSVHIMDNWDIWVYNGTWHRKTHSPAIDMDPSWDDEDLVFSSNATGTFQIYINNMIQLTEEKYGAVLPRKGRYIAISENGCETKPYSLQPRKPFEIQKESEYSDHIERSQPESGDMSANTHPYTPLKSLFPNFVSPDLYVSEFDVQFGFFTRSRDVTKDFQTNAGMRYSVDLEYLSVSAGAGIKDVAIQASRYPLSYSTESGTFAHESRNEFSLTWEPFGLEWIALTLSKRYFEDLDGNWTGCSDTWAGLHLNKQYGDLFSWGRYERYTSGTTSLYGGFYFLMGSEIYSVIQIQGGRTWQDYDWGHESFRIGGNIEEGYFTKRPSRLFPLRGFDSNILEAGSAVTSKIEIYWPLFNIQKGYQTLPLFFHRLRLGTFADAGACSDNMSMEDLLVGTGVEFIMSMEVAWGIFSQFRIGVAWPAVQPEYLDESGPVLVVQIGSPL